MCHGAQQQMSGLRLDRPDAILRVVQPGSSAGSKLVERVSSTKPGFFMPPMGARLTATEIETIRAWIDSGAKMPASAATPSKNTHWSFQPVRKPEPPQVRNRSWVRNPIDQFVLARLEKKG